MDNTSVAIYLDFENLALSAETVYPSRDYPLKIEPILDYASTKGDVLLRRAYGDWTRPAFNRYQSQLMEHGFELVHLPETNSQGKNGSDVRLAIDVMEYVMHFPEIDTLIIGSGDTDFIPLIQRMRTKGKEVIVMGFEHSVGALVKRNSAEFISLEKILGSPESESLNPDMGTPHSPAYGRRLLERYIRSRPEESPVLLAKLKQQLLRFDPSFSERDLGFPSFKHWLLSLQGDLVKGIDVSNPSLPTVHLADTIPTMTEEPSGPASREMAQQFLLKNLRYNQDHEQRIKLSTAIIAGFNRRDALSMSELFDFVFEYLDQEQPKSDIKKYINTLFTGGAFEPIDRKMNGSLLARPLYLREDILSAQALDEIYIQRIGEILQSRYTVLHTYEILDLMI
ncbi:MAG: NYN domain-containing protein [Bacteroidia bacterium]|nr:NYN domain-containing protein [Bacteroidia bacterium]